MFGPGGDCNSRAASEIVGEGAHCKCNVWMKLEKYENHSLRIISKGKYFAQVVIAIVELLVKLLEKVLIVMFG